MLNESVLIVVTDLIDCSSCSSIHTTPWLSHAVKRILDSPIASQQGHPEAYAPQRVCCSYPRAGRHCNAAM